MQASVMPRVHVQLTNNLHEGRARARELANCHICMPATGKLCSMNTGTYYGCHFLCSRALNLISCQAGIEYGYKGCVLEGGRCA